jgi:hypothetical protein
MKKKSKKIVRNGMIIYQPRKNQFGHMTVSEFMVELKKERRVINLTHHIMNFREVK